MVVTGGARRLRADAARNREALIEAARGLFSCRGVSATLDDIAAAAGLNVATAYRHFANKQELLAAFLQQAIDEAIAIAEQAAAAVDPWEGLSDFLTRTLDLIMANRGLHDVLMPGCAEDWMQRLDERVDPALQGLISRGQAADLIRADLKPADLGVVLQMLAALADIPTSDQAGLCARYLALILAGLRPSRPRLPGSAPTPAQVRAAVSTSSRQRRSSNRPQARPSPARRRRSA